MGNRYIFRGCYVLSLLFCLTTLQLLAQTASIPQAPTGNASAMTIFGQYPQSSYTGVPAINIPVYNFTYDGLSLPIALSYNNNLVKPYNPGSWVGLGWDLTAGGVINRIVNGKPDDCNWYNRADYDKTSDTQMGYYYNHGYLSVSNWYDSLRIHHAFTDLYNVLAYTGSEDVTSCNIRDYAPDEFDFSIGDLSGSFYLDENGDWKVKSENPVKVIATFDEIAEPSPVANHTFLKAITLIDKRGIKYEFGNANTNNGLEIIKSDGLDSTDTFVKSWYINRITLPDGKRINFNYISSTAVDYEQPSSVNAIGLVSTMQKNHPIYLSSIETDLITISFITSERPSHHRELDTIKIEDAYDAHETKKFSFAYTPTLNNSFKLTDFSQLDKNDHPGVHYGFQYNALHFGSGSNSIDHWGYYTMWHITTNTYSSMARDTARCRAELLDRITYPTGGYTVYTWEPNFADWYIDASNTVQRIFPKDTYHPGGARIKQVTNYDNLNGKLSSKRYVYDKNYKNGNFDHVYLPSGVVHAIPSGGTTFTLLNYELGNESHVTYSEVAEINDDGSYTTTTYSNSDNGFGNEAYNNFIQVSSADSIAGKILPNYTSNAYKRGFPLSIKNFSSTDTLLSEKDFQYAEGNHQYIRALLLNGEASSYNKNSVAYRSQPDGWTGSTVKIYTSNFLPYIVREKNYYHGVDSLVKATVYQYDDTTVNLTNVQVANSKGHVEETKYMYPSDMVHNGLDPHGVYAAMDSANYTSPVIETIKTLSGVQLALTKTEYKKFIANDHTFFTPDSAVVQYGTNPAKTTSKYIAYDNNGHLITELQNGIVPVTYIYDYTGNFVIAKVVNATKNEVAFRDFETPPIFADLTMSGAGHSGSHYYKGFNPPVFAVPNTRSYVISDWYHISGNVWKYAKMPYPSPSYAPIYPSAANALDDVLIYPADAQVTTYDYDWLAGLTNITDNNGHTIYYEYDDLQRLVNIRDEDGNIKTHYCYNYAGEETDCTVPFVPALSPPPDPPPPPYSPYGVYARLEISDVANELYGSGDESSVYQTGNVCVKIYSDPACTIPLTLDHDLTIGLTFTTNQIDDGTVTSTDSENDVYIIPAGQNSYCLGTMDLDDFVSFLDEDNNSHYEEFIYGYTMTTSPYYAVITTIYP